MNVNDIVELASGWCFGWGFDRPSEVVIDMGRTRGGLWHPPHGDKPAWISIGCEDGLDLVFHEVFHSVAHRAPFSRSSKGWFTEGFCNAFSEFARGEFYPHRWEKHDPSNKHHREYLGACLALREYVESIRNTSPTRTLDPFLTLRNVWRGANERRLTADEFSDLLGYNPKTGNRKIS